MDGLNTNLKLLREVQMEREKNQLSSTLIFDYVRTLSVVN